MYTNIYIYIYVCVQFKYNPPLGNSFNIYYIRFVIVTLFKFLIE